MTIVQTADLKPGQQSASANLQTYCGLQHG